MNHKSGGLKIDGKTLLNHLQELGNTGADPVKGGRTRTALTDAEKQGRDLVVSWMKALDLVIRIDQIGNIFGTLPSVSGNSDTAPLMIGSHIDTVINAGALDGCYGVLSGLAVVRAFREAGVLPSRPITVAAFTNEEGVRFHPDMMGSLVYAGGYPLEDALNAVATDGAVLRDELERAGYAGSMVPGSIVPHEYLELHIEQGPVLEAEGLQIGVVESLQGISWQKITITGTANHAGTTPTRLRHDAGYAAAKLITFLREGISQKNGATLTTVGTIAFEPNAVNVIPGSATFTIDMRDPDEERLQWAEGQIRDYLAVLSEQEGVTVSARQLARFQPVVFDKTLVSCVENAARAAGSAYRRMPSGAGHDAQMIARIAPAAMIFVPSKNGISHNPAEYTEDGDLIRGAQVLLDTVILRLAEPV